MRTMPLWTVVLVGLANAQHAAPPKASTPDQEPELLAPIDFAKVDRTAPKLPESKAHRTFGLYLFGLRGERRVWAVLEAATATEPPATLWLDLDADGELETNESFPAEVGKPRQAGEAAPRKFTIGTWSSPGSDVAHRDVTITWTPKIGVRFRMLWRGEKVSFGGYGPSHDTYASFAAEPQAAPVFVPGYDRPFAFERWIADPLRRGSDSDFKVFVGNRGDRVGAFSAVDDEFLPEGELVVATLQYRDRAGKPATARFELKQKC